MPDITTTITLGGLSYTIRKPKMGQLRRLLSKDTNPGDFGFLAIKLALERAEPKPEADFEEIDTDVTEFNAALKVIGEFWGLKPAGEAPAGTPST